MRLIIDERIKHRLTGMIVILSIAVIFIPAVVKKSNHHFEENIHLTVNLPAKPPLPKVAIANDQVMFQSVKVARVSIPPMVQDVQVSKIARAEPLSIKSSLPGIPVVNKKPIVAQVKLIPKLNTQVHSKVVVTTLPAKVRVPPPAKKLTKVVLADKKPLYGVQLASFTQQKNAELLVTRLRSKGYIASYNKFTSKQGEYYKVIVGKVNQKNAAKTLQKQLATNMQLQGFVVKTGVS